MKSNKKLVILGAAESGVGAALLGMQQGWDVFVTDGGKIREDYKQNLERAGIAYEEHGHTLSRIEDAACIVKSPGIPEKAPVMQQLRATGIEICSEIDFGYRYKGDSRIVAITGSNGKSTTTKLIHHTFTQAGLDAALTGNIGISFARRIAERPAAWYVVEVSSFQLDDIHAFRPDIAILLNITPDHLDRYGYQMANYVASKFNITKFQTEQDILILNQDDPEIAGYLKDHSFRAKQIFFTMNEEQRMQEGAYIHDDQMHISYDGESTDMSIHDLSLAGKHNQYNSMAAGITARVADIRRDRIRESFSTFQGLEHRLEYVATIRDVRFINDSKATNINSVWYALESMTAPTVLILGGQDKGNDYRDIMDLVQEKVKAIICMGVDNKTIHDTFEGMVRDVIDVESAQDAVKVAYDIAEKGDVVLLAPGCASFDRFKNFEDRGEQFKAAVRAL